MSNDERPDSLAAQAAAWVPPWERQQLPPDRDYQAARRAEVTTEADGPSTETEARVEGDAGDEAVAEELAAGADDTGADGLTAVTALDDDEVESAAGLSDDDDDFDEAFEGSNPPGYAGAVEDGESEPAALPGEAAAEDAATGDASPELPGERGDDSEVDQSFTEVVPPADEDADEDVPAAVAADEGASAAAGGDLAVGDEPLGAQPAIQPEAESIVDAGRAQAGSAVPAQGRRRRDGADASGEPTPRTSDGVDLPDLLGDAELAAALESIMLVVDEPVVEMQLAQILEQPTERIAGMLEDLSARYTAAGHGFDLRRVAGGWRLYTRPEYAAYVERFVLDGQSVRLTQAALETLAVVAYKQPVTRSRISAIRGVNCDGVMRTLVTRGLIEECGTEGETGAYLYRTTALFLEKLGLNSVDQLPPLAPFLPDDVEEVLDATG